MASSESSTNALLTNNTSCITKNPSSPAKVSVNLDLVPTYLIPFIPDELIYKKDMPGHNNSNRKRAKNSHSLIVGCKAWIEHVKSLKAIHDRKIRRELEIQDMVARWKSNSEVALH